MQKNVIPVSIVRHEGLQVQSKVVQKKVKYFIPVFIKLFIPPNRTRRSLNSRSIGTFLDSVTTGKEKEDDNRKAFPAVRGLVLEYCDTTTVHGVKYLVQRKRPFLER